MFIVLSFAFESDMYWQKIVIVAILFIPISLAFGDYCRKTMLADSKKKSYNVIFADKIDIEQFYEKYEIIDKKDNNIYTIKEK